MGLGAPTHDQVRPPAWRLVPPSHKQSHLVSRQKKAQIGGFAPRNLRGDIARMGKGGMGGGGMGAGGHAFDVPCSQIMVRTALDGAKEWTIIEMQVSKAFSRRSAKPSPP